MATPILPTEVIANILSRLRVKPLLRFKTVSKSWYSLINSPKFIKLHLSQTLISDNHPNLIISHYSLSSAVIDDGGSDKKLRTIRFSDLDHPLKHLPGQPSVQILGSCHGLVLVSDYFQKYVYLYNPSNKTHRLLPPFYPSYKTNPVFDKTCSFNPKDANIVIFGFGYDSVSDDYKALRVIQTLNNNAVVYRETAVYSLRSDSWKCVVDEQLRDFQPLNGGLFNECLHFIVSDDSPCQLAIKCFNLQTETFSIISIPRDYGGRCCMYTGELGGYFCLGINYLHCSVPKDNWVQTDNERLVMTVLWVMKEYGKEESWVKMFMFSPEIVTGCLREVRPVLFSKDWRRLLVSVDGYWFGWYDIKNNKFKRIKSYGTSVPPAPFETWTVVDNLFSLQRHEVKSKGGTAIKKVKAHETPAPSAIVKTWTDVDSLVSLLKQEGNLKGGTATVKVKAHETPSPSAIIKTRTDVDTHVSLHDDEVKSKGGTATKKKGKHSVSKGQVKQDAHSVARTSHNQGDDFNLHVGTQITSRNCSTPGIDNLSKEFMLRLTGDATDRT